MALEHQPQATPRELSAVALLNLRLRLGIQNGEPTTQTSTELKRLAKELRLSLPQEEWGDVVRFLALVEAVMQF